MHNPFFGVIPCNFPFARLQLAASTDVIGSMILMDLKIQAKSSVIGSMILKSVFKFIVIGSMILK